MTDEQTILERMKGHKEDPLKAIVYGLRLLVADVLDISTDGAMDKPTRTETGRYQDAIKDRWEEGRHSELQISTHLQAKSLVFNAPDISWVDVRAASPELGAEVSRVRRAYYLKVWKEQRLAHAYRRKLLDLLIGGEATMECGKRDGKTYFEYVDALDCTWDSAYTEVWRRRYYFRDKHLPYSEAVRHYPRIAEMLKGTPEQSVTVTCYWDKHVRAVLFNGRFIDGPKPHPFGRIPANPTILFDEPSKKGATGMAELQIGTHRLDLRLQRYFREVLLTGASARVAAGQFEEGSIEALESGKENVILRSANPSSTLVNVPGSEIQASALTMKEMLRQQSAAASGVNDFMQNRTDTKVDFASQLQLMAQQGGVLAEFTQQQHEEGIREDARMLLEIAAFVETGPMELDLDGITAQFDETMPLAMMLGGDGEVQLAPGGMRYKAPAQKLQEQMVLAQALQQAVALPPGLMEPHILDTLKAFEIEDAEERVAAMVQARQQMMEQQAMMAAQQEAPQPSSAP